MSFQKPLATGIITFGSTKYVFNADTSFATTDAGAAAASSFVGEMYLANMIQDFMPTSIAHMTNGIATGATYLAIQQFKPTSPFSNPIAQFLYAFGLSEISDTMIVPMLPGSNNYGSVLD